MTTLSPAARALYDTLSQCLFDASGDAAGARQPGRDRRRSSDHA